MHISKVLDRLLLSLEDLSTGFHTLLYSKQVQFQNTVIANTDSHSIQTIYFFLSPGSYVCGYLNQYKEEVEVHDTSRDEAFL